HINVIEKLNRAITPIVLPTEAGLSFDDVVDRSAAVVFDLDGTGATRWQWISPQGAWLVYDPGEGGAIISGLQLFGNVTFWLFWDHGYDALAALDDDGDGWLRGEELTGLAAWQDVDADGVSDPGEVQPLGSLEIIGIAVDSEEQVGVRMN